MQKTTLEKLKLEVKRLARSADPKVKKFVEMMRQKYQDLAR